MIEDQAGEVRFDHVGKRWVVICEADVMHRLKRVFERIPKSAMGAAPLADSPFNAKELRWFLMGYPMAMSAEDRAYLERRAEEEVVRQRSLSKVLRGEYTPTKFQVALKPWDFQYLPVELCFAGGGVLCADEVGLGKTLEGTLLISDPRARPALVVCPTHLVAHWQAKLAEYLPGIRVHAVKTGKPYPLTRDGRGRELPHPDVILCTFAKLAGWAELLATVVKSMVVDEVHNLCHEWSDSNQTQKVKKYAAAIHLRDRVPYRMGLSGSPVKGYGGEIRTVMNVLLQDPLGTQEEFGREHCGGYGGEKARVKNPDALGALMVRKGLMTNRTREQVGRVLPPLKVFVQPIEVDLDPLRRVKIETLEFAKTLLRRGGDSEDKRNAAKEISWKLRHATGLAKAPHVAEFVKILAGRAPVLLFGWHRDFWRVMAKDLRDFSPVFYTGEETPQQKAKAVEAFLSGKATVFCMSLRAGEGVDGLQKVCSTVVVGELDWSWTQMMKQNVGRLLREGQTQPVFVHVPLADAGSDPTMADALGVKREQFQGLIRPGEEHVDPAQMDPDHAKNLARAWLAAHDPRALAAIEAEIADANDAKAAEKADRAAKRAAKKSGGVVEATQVAPAPVMVPEVVPIAPPRRGPRNRSWTSR